MATATDSTEPPPPRYFGPCLVAPLVLHAQQPEPAAWVPPREWNPATAGWDPRITYRGLSADAKASLTEEFLLFEVPGHADDDPEDPAVQQGKGHVLWLPCDALSQHGTHGQAAQRVVRCSVRGQKRGPPGLGRRVPPRRNLPRGGWAGKGAA